MSVMTYDEYEKSGKTIKNKAGDKNSPALFKEKKQIEKNIKQIKEVYILGHPENGFDNPKNFKDQVNIGGEKIMRECVNGKVVTDSKALLNYLLNNEYFLLDTIIQEV